MFRVDMIVRIGKVGETKRSIVQYSVQRLASSLPRSCLTQLAIELRNSFPTLRATTVELYASKYSNRSNGFRNHSRSPNAKRLFPDAMVMNCLP